MSQPGGLSPDPQAVGEPCTRDLDLGVPWERWRDTQNASSVRASFLPERPPEPWACATEWGVGAIDTPKTSTPYPLEPEPGVPARGKDPEELSSLEHPGGPMSSSPRL